MSKLINYYFCVFKRSLLPPAPPGLPVSLVSSLLRRWSLLSALISRVPLDSCPQPRTPRWPMIGQHTQLPGLWLAGADSPVTPGARYVTILPMTPASNKCRHPPPAIPIISQLTSLKTNCILIITLFKLIMMFRMRQCDVSMMYVSQIEECFTFATGLYKYLWAIIQN